MGFLTNIARKVGLLPENSPLRKRFNFSVNNTALNDFIFDIDRQKRGYNAAKTDRLAADWLSTGNSANEEIKNALKIVRARARDLYNNNDIAKKYVRLCQNNIIGPKGIKLQMKVKGALINGQEDPAQNDDFANNAIEQAWKDFCKPENCTVTGKLSMRAVCNLVLTHVARDGDCFIYKNKGAQYKYGFALQVVEPDHVDETINKDSLKNGNYIRMGVELTPQGKPVAYYVRKNGERLSAEYGSFKDVKRILAKDIIHIYDPDRADQARGISWMVQSMIHLKMLDGYEEAALINARVSAAKMGFFTSDSENYNEYEGDEVEAGTNDTITKVEPGRFEQLPPGLKFESWTPEFPHSQHDAFVKRTLMSISAGLGVSYNSLANDLEGVNYSSIRSGVLDEREMWKMLQTWFIESFLEPVFEAWLQTALLTKHLKLPEGKFEKFNKPTWIARTWSWVDPLKDIKAAKEAIAANVTTHTIVANEQGLDFDEVVDSLKAEKEKLKNAGLISEEENAQK